MNDPDNTDYIHTDDAFDYVITNMSTEMIEYVAEKHSEEVLEYIYPKKREE